MANLVRCYTYRNGETNMIFPSHVKLAKDAVVAREILVVRQWILVGNYKPLCSPYAAPMHVLQHHMY